MRTFPIILFLFFTLALGAQNQKGNWYLDGTTDTRYESVLSKHTPDNSSFSINAFRAGYFLTNRLLIGTGINFRSFKYRIFLATGSAIRLRPFARYYFSGSGKRKVNFFGEISCGTFDLFNVSNGDVISDYNFGLGAEINLRPGILGTVQLRNSTNFQSLNVTSLTFGLNVLTGQLKNAGAAGSLTEGTFTARAGLGSIEHIRINANDWIEQSTNVNLVPWVGFFVSDRFMLEGGLQLFYRSTGGHDLGESSQEGVKVISASVGANINLRYYLKGDGTLLPYLMAGGGLVHSSRSFRNSVGDTSGSSQVVPFRIGAGASYFLSSNLILDAELAYDSYKQVNDFQVVNTITDRTVGLELGLRFYLPKS